MALAGPVTQVGTQPSIPIKRDPYPQTTVRTLIGALYPTVFRTDTPCIFCTAITEITSGITNSIMASIEKVGVIIVGSANQDISSGITGPLPTNAAAIIPETSALNIGGV